MGSPFYNSEDHTTVQEHHIHGILGYFTVAASILTIGSTLALLLSSYELASRSLSTRQGVQRRKLINLFLGLAVACFVVITVLKYADPDARREVANTLSGAHGGADGSQAGLGGRGEEDGRLRAREEEHVPMEQRETPAR
jgi:uncharacterized membrane protein